MDQQQWLAERFEQHRPRLRAVSYRMLGSVSEAEDAVQEAWLRLSRTDAETVDDLGAWLTTVVARLCLNTLRSRRAHPQEPIGPHLPDPLVSAADDTGPEAEALTADSVGLALLVVLDTLTPAERLAFVLHDVFDVPFSQIAEITDRTEPAVRQLASRARRRVQSTAPPDTSTRDQWKLVDAFLAASRDGDFEGLLRVLDAEVVLRVDTGATGPGQSRIVQGAQAVASGAVVFSRLGYSPRRVVVNGAPGLVAFDGDRPLSVLGFSIRHGRIVEMNILSDPERLQTLNLAAAARPA